MAKTQSTLERAFELAASGKFSQTGDIRKQLAKENFQVEQVSGGTLVRQLRDIMKAAISAGNRNKSGTDE
jgi:hypothetical protein